MMEMLIDRSNGENKPSASDSLGPECLQQQFDLS